MIATRVQKLKTLFLKFESILKFLYDIDQKVNFNID